MHELYYGAFKSQRTARNVALIDALQFEVMDLDQEDAKQAGEIRALLATRGAPIGPYDVLIAAEQLRRPCGAVGFSLALANRALARLIASAATALGRSIARARWAQAHRSTTTASVRNAG